MSSLLSHDEDGEQQQMVFLGSKNEEEGTNDFVWEWDFDISDLAASYEQELVLCDRRPNDCLRDHVCGKSSPVEVDDDTVISISDEEDDELQFRLEL